MGVGPGLGVGVGAGVGAGFGRMTGIAIGERVGTGVALGWVGSCSWMAWHPKASSAPGSSRVNGQRPPRMRTSLSLETTSTIYA